MEDRGRSSRMVRFGVYEVDRDACELRRTGQVIPLQIQPFRVLEVLVDLAGAEREFDAAERVSPNSAPSLAGLALVAARKGDTARAHTLLAAVQSLADASDDPCLSCTPWVWA